MAHSNSGKHRFPLWIPILALVLVLCVCAVWFWEPLLSWTCPELALTIALSNTLSKVSARLDSPLTNCICQCVGYVQDGAMDAELSLSGLLTESSYRITSASDPANRQQSSSFEIRALGLNTGLTTYLDGDCAVFSSPLLGEMPYGITFQSFEEDLTAAGFDQSLSPETLAKLRQYVQELDAVYPNNRSRAATPELPTMDAPLWIRTMLAYLRDLEFQGNGGSSVSIGEEVYSMSRITTAMDGQYGANMLLEALKTLSTNVLFASSLYSEEDANTPALQERLEYYRDHTDGQIQLTGFLHKGALVDVAMEWTFTQNNGTMDIPDQWYVHLALWPDPSTDDWTLYTQETRGKTYESTGYTFHCDGSHYTLSEAKYENRVLVETVLDLFWDADSGLLAVDLAKTTGENKITASTSGTMLRTADRVSIDIAGLEDILELLTLPDFLQHTDLSMIKNAHLVAEFQAETDIQRPDYLNLDQWELPWFLDFFL